MRVTEDQIEAVINDPEMIYPDDPKYPNERVIYQRGQLVVVVEHGEHEHPSDHRPLARQGRTMSKWQGIGAAVDAHLALLGQANRGVHIARKIKEATINDRPFTERLFDAARHQRVDVAVGRLQCQLRPPRCRRQADDRGRRPGRPDDLRS